MGDAGEGLIDAESRIQERMEEMQSERALKSGREVRDPELHRALDSLKLARTQLQRQLNATANAGRKVQLTQALAEVDRRMAETSSNMIH
jgi:hypothetical protein